MRGRAGGVSVLPAASPGPRHTRRHRISAPDAPWLTTCEVGYNSQSCVAPGSTVAERPTQGGMYWRSRDWGIWSQRICSIPPAASASNQAATRWRRDTRCSHTLREILQQGGGVWLLHSPLWPKPKGPLKALRKQVPRLGIDQPGRTFALKNLHDLLGVPLGHDMP